MYELEPRDDLQDGLIALINARIPNPPAPPSPSIPTVIIPSAFGKTGANINSKAAITATTTALTINPPAGTASFSPTDVGKAIQVVGAGASGFDLYTTIAAFVSSTAVTLTDPAGSTVTDSQIFWYPVGTDDTVAIQTAINNCTEGQGTVILTGGLFVISSGIVPSQFCKTLVGAGASQTWIVVSSPSFRGDMITLSRATGQRVSGFSCKHTGNVAPTDVTGWSITSNVATLTGNNTFQPGDPIVVMGFITGGGGAFFESGNDCLVTVTSATPTSFSFNFTHADGSGSDTAAAFLDNNCFNCIRNGATQTGLTQTDCYAFRAPGAGFAWNGMLVSRADGLIGQSCAVGLAVYRHNVNTTSFTRNACYANGNKLAGHWESFVQYSTHLSCASDGNGKNYWINKGQGHTWIACGSENPRFFNASFNGAHYYVDSLQGATISGANMFPDVTAGSETNTYMEFIGASNIWVGGVFFSGTTNLPANVFLIDPGCVDITVWEPQFGSNPTTNWVDSGTNSTIYYNGAHHTPIVFATDETSGSHMPIITVSPALTGTGKALNVWGAPASTVAGQTGGDVIVAAGDGFFLNTSGFGGNLALRVGEGFTANGRIFFQAGQGNTIGDVFYFVVDAPGTSVIWEAPNRVISVTYTQLAPTAVSVGVGTAATPYIITAQAGGNTSAASQGGHGADLRLGGGNGGTGTPNGVGGAVAINSALKLQQRTVTGTYTVDSASISADLVIFLDSTAGPFTVTLPSITPNRTIIFQDKGHAGTNNVTISKAGGTTINGATTLVMATNFQQLRVISDGSNWFAG